MTFQPNTIVHTRDGRRAEILVVLPPERKTKGGHTIVALVEHGGGGAEFHNYDSNGRFFSDRKESCWDLLPGPAPVSVIADRMADVLHFRKTGKHPRHRAPQE